MTHEDAYHQDACPEAGIDRQGKAQTNKDKVHSAGRKDLERPAVERAQGCRRICGQKRC